MKILVYGALNLDFVYRLSHICRPGETISSKSLTVNCGGKGLNQSIALARAGAEVYHFGAIGHDGGMLKQALADSGVRMDFLVTREDMPSGQAIIQVDDEGQNCILLFGGTNRAIPEENMDQVLSHFEAGDYLLLQNEVNGNGTIMEKAHTKGMKIVLNPSPMDEAVNTLPLEYVDWFLLNEGEMEAICGGNVETLMANYPRANVMLTLGHRGSVCYWEGKRYPFGIYRTKVVDTTAAGDTFTGYFIAGLVAGKRVEEAVAVATKASSVAVSRPGACPSIPYPHEVAAHDGQYVEFIEEV